MRRSLLTTVALTLGTTALTLPLAGPAATAAPAYSVQTLHFKVGVGPDRAKICDVVGDLYLPGTATAARPVPAILTTNGFGGSKDDQAGIGKAFAQRGYAVLSYSGLGFGGSDCQITLDDPDYDGVAGSQLVDYLGGHDGIAFLDDAHTKPAPALTVVKRDATDHDGVARTDDPRVGMVGGSYGGGAQFAVASVDARVDTLVPMITWNDLSYSLSPNNTSQTTGVSTSTPGAAKLFWAAGFSATGLQTGLENAPTDPARLAGCPNFATWVCPGLIFAGVGGYVDPATTAALRHASVSSYLPKIKVPTLLAQGEFDTLFNLNEAAATYSALKAQGTPVKMIWHSWGHSAKPLPGEVDLGNPDPVTQYETRRIANWFDHYLKDRPTSTGPEFAYFRDWVPFTGNAAPAYAGSAKFPVGTARRFQLSGKALTPTAVAGAPQTFLTLPAGLPTSTNPIDAIGSLIGAPLPETDLAGTFAGWNSAPLTQALNVVGSPELTVEVKAPLAEVTQATGPLGMLVLFVRLQDVGARREGQRHPPADRAGPDPRRDQAGAGEAARDRAPVRPRPPAAARGRGWVGELPRRPDRQHRHDRVRDVVTAVGPLKSSSADAADVIRFRGDRDRVG